MSKLPSDVTKEEFLRAVRNGVRDAMWQMITNATDMPCHDFYDTIKEGVKEAMVLQNGNSYTAGSSDHAS